MNKLGFVKSEPGMKVRSVDFFKANIVHFLKMFGFNPVDTTCTIQKMDDVDFSMEITQRLVSATSDSQLFVKGDVVRICISTQLQRALNQGDSELWVERYWCYFAKYMHLWAVKRCEVPINELVPAKILLGMPDTEETVAKLNEMFDNHGWTGLETAQNYAADAVGIHVATMMNSAESVINAIQPREIAEIIFQARANNWDKLTAAR